MTTRLLAVCSTRAALGVLGAAMLSSGAWAQTHTLKLVVPYPPGGGVDTMARIVAEEIGRVQHQPIVVENRPGGGTVIATEAVSRAEPDGNTLLVANNAYVITPLFREADQRRFFNLVPICDIASTPTIVGVNAQSPYKTLADLVSAAKAEPGTLTYGASAASTTLLGTEILLHAANIRMTYVPFAGTAPMVNALLGQFITMSMVDYTAAAGQLEAGSLRALAVASPARFRALPDVPTVAESGYPDYESVVWYGVMAPPKTPKDTISRLIDWFGAAARAPGAIAKLKAQGLDPDNQCGDAFAARLEKQTRAYSEAKTAANIK